MKDTSTKRLHLNGKRLANPPPGDEVVISGMAGRFPISDNIEQFAEYLYNKTDLVTDETGRSNFRHPEVPLRSGKINHITKFDAGFFDVHHKHAQHLDPTCRMFLEKTFEAICDAGINPAELKGTKTGVFLGLSFSASEVEIINEVLVPQSHAITGCIRSMFAQRVSNFLQVEGPSIVYDAACSSSLYALDEAYKAIREGQCETAIVGGGNLLLTPNATLQFSRFGVLSLDGSCKSFDESANGYVRSEASVAIVLQKAKNARRIYAQIVHSRTNCDGYKEHGITYPSAQIQKLLLEEFYAEIDIEQESLSYLEAHGTGTKIGDPEELAAMDAVLCQGRKSPLLIGSVKSNMGHSESASGLCSIVKCIIAMETGYIPPNIRFNKPRSCVEGLLAGRMRVVTEKTPFPDGTITAGVNNFGFGGANAHVLLRSNTKKKIDNGLPKDDLPRLICVSARTEESMNMLLDDLSKRPLDAENIRMLHEIFKTHISGFKQRGFVVLSKKEVLCKSAKFCDGLVNPVYCVFGDGVDLRKFGTGLITLPAFMEHIKRIDSLEIWPQLGINVLNAVTKSASDNNTNQAVATVAIQTGLYEILKILNVSFAGFAGTAVGKLSAAYADGAVTLEQALLAAYQCDDNKSWDILSKQLQSVISRNGENNKWISRPTDIIKSLAKDVLSTDESLNFPRDTVVLEIGRAKVGHLFQTIKLLDSKEEDGVKAFLLGLGHLYQTGTDLKLDKLYPPIQWPVSSGTPKISHLMKWQHSRDYNVGFHDGASIDPTLRRDRLVQINASTDDWQFIKGHVINGRLLYAATGYLVLVWDTLAYMSNRLKINVKVAFEKVRFNRACTVPSKGKLELLITIQEKTGQFEILEGDVAVVTGYVREIEDMENHWEDFVAKPAAFSDPESELSSKDVYKELRLRGYNYKDQFRAIKSYNSKTNAALIPWEDNWVTFMDNMLQVQILRKDTRSLFVPTRIELVLIDPQKHISYVQSFGENPVIPVYVHQEFNILRSGGIEFREMTATSITKRKQGDPVLETYQFVPNDCQLNLELAVRCLMQLAMEASPSLKIKGVELLDEFVRKDDQALAPIIFLAVADQPLIQPELYVFTKEMVEVDFATVADKQISDETDCYLVIGTSLFQRSEMMPSVINSLKQSGFIISREDLSTDPYNHNFKDLMVIATYNTGKERLVLLRKDIHCKTASCIKVENDDLSWLEETQKLDGDIVLYANDEKSGILGFTNCFRKEGNDNVSCFFMDETSPDFDLNAPFYKIQRDKYLPINILKNGVWGTYRHLPLQSSPEVESNHSLIIPMLRGDLNSIRWVQGNITSNNINRHANNQLIVHNCVCSLNFKDVMLASGKLAIETVVQSRLEEECILGLEFSGLDETGRRVMGLIKTNALSTIVLADRNLLWEIPDHWTMEEAASVPCVYGTVLLGLLARANMRRGQSILIHSATGGIGLAAINVCLHFDCTIYCTVSTDDKREFLRKNYPQIDQNNIGNSRDTSFEQIIMKRTKGRGVDLVLNSLSEEKMQASLRCVARGGSFLEIGKIDLANDSPLPLEIFQKDVAVHGIMLESSFDGILEIKRAIWDLVQEGINQGYVKPLPLTVFDRDEAVEAFRYMTTGKHIGKVILRVRESEAKHSGKVPNIANTKCVPRVSADPDKVYIIVGGLGGFGLELADWLVIRGARKIVLTSRNGITTGYQSHRINVWKSYGTTINISSADVTTSSGVSDLFKSASELGQVDGIFNLAVVLQDAFFENQTVEMFRTSLNPKAVATKLLDEYSRKHCPTLSHFITFSSVSCGRGNAGQTNYGMANSVMERICERRKMDGLPGLAIQWGVVGDVGLVAEKAEDSVEVVIGGTLPQKISSCLQALDTFMKQNAPVVSSMVVAEKKAPGKADESILQAVCATLGFKDLKSVSLHSTLPELGMDSMMAVELRQMLEREYELFLTPQDIRSMTLAKLSEITTSDSGDKHEKDVDNNSLPLLLRFIPPECDANDRLVDLPTRAKHSQRTLIFLPGIEGSASSFKALANKLANFKAACFQYDHNLHIDDLNAIVNYVCPIVEETAKKEGRFFLAAHSFGTLVALEVASILRRRGYFGQLFLIDGSPCMMKAAIEAYFDNSNEDFFQTSLLTAIMCTYMAVGEVLSHKAKLLEYATFEERIKYAISVSPKNTPHTPEYLTCICKSLCRRVKIACNYKQSFRKLDCEVSLFKATVPLLASVTEDYGLADCIGHPVSVTLIDGDHATIVENDVLATAIDASASVSSDDKSINVV